MSGDKLDVNTEQLTKFGAQSDGMAADLAAVPPLVTPPATVTSPLDAPLVALAEAIRGAVSAAESADKAAVTKQAAALSEAATAFVQQDQQNANDTIMVGQQFKVLTYPTLHAAPPTPGVQSV